MLDRFFSSPQQRFAAEALQAARRTPGVRRAERVPGEFAIAVHYTAGAGGPGRLYLSNAFHELAGEPKAVRLERLARMVRVLAMPSDDGDWDAVREKLRPVLRPVTFGMGVPAGMPPPLSRPSLPFLRELVVVDHPDAMAYVVPARLDDWGVGPDEVFAAARENLAELGRSSLRRPWPDDPGIISMLDDGNGYFTSMLMVPGWLGEVSALLGHQVIAFAPDNNTLLLCPLGDGTGELFAAVERVFADAPRGVSPMGYVADGLGRTVPYDPPAGHPHHAVATRAAAVLAATEYGNQTQWLAGQYAAAGIEVQVGALVAVAPPGGGARTVATWPDGVSALLPGADTVAFADAAGVARFQVPWAVVAEHTGLRPEPLLAPARYKVDGWPPPSVVDELRRHGA